MVQHNKTLDETKNPKYTSNHCLNMARPLGCNDPGDEIVISGMSGTFPGARNVQDFKDNLFNKVRIDESQNRWAGYEHPELPKIGGIIPDFTKYDAGFFGVHQRQSDNMDAGNRQLQERAIEAIFDAGLHPSDLENTRTGVYVGTCFNETEKKCFNENVTPHTYAWTGCARSMQPHRLSYFLKLKGPSIVSDTACSSSLYAFEHAFRAFALGEIDNAIVAGTNLCLHPFTTLQFARLGVLSMDGACKVFDKTGNGYLRSEAIVVVLLQRLKNANRVYAEAVYAKTNCDGYKEQGITFPSSETQTALLNEFYKECNVDPFSLSYLEAHGTGTTVGDSEEASAVDSVLTKNRKTPLLIGSLKSNIGHTESSSGVCSIIKCIIGMETGFIPPNINYSTPRDDIRGIIEGRMKVVTEKMKFQDNKGLVGVNSFGFGGANCHVLLRWNQKQKVNNGIPTDALPRLVGVSGRTEEAISCLLDELSNNELDIEHIKLLHNIFRKNIQNHLYRGYSIVSKSGEITRSLQYFNGNQKPLCVLFGELTNWREIGNDLMDMPVFANSIQRMQEFLLDKEINLLNMLLNNTIDSKRQEILGSVAVQIGIMDILHLLKIKPNNCLGFSFGILVAAYYNEHISLKETINCALVINEFLDNVNEQCKSKNNNFRQGNQSGNVNGDNLNGTMTVFESLKSTLRANKSLRERLSTSLTDILGEQLPKNKHRSAEYFIDALMNNLISDFQSIDLNYILFKVTCSAIQEDVDDMIVISSINFKRKNYVVGLLESFGSLYEYGYNPQMENLYPAIDLPVSRGTRMISPYIKWKHDRDWFIPQFSLDLVTRNYGTAVCHVQLTDRTWTFLDGHVIDGRNLFPATGYLYLVWQTLAYMYGRTIGDVKVTFENCKFVRATTIPNKTELRFDISIQRSTGNFEIVESGALVVTGRIYKLNDDKQAETISNLHTDSSNDLPLKMKDVYKELRLRGYHYKGGFRAIQECDAGATRAYIKWNENWITFMDNMLQVKILQFDSRLLYVPTYIARLTIDPQEHRTYLEKQGPSSDLVVYNDQPSGIISSGGIQIWGLTASSVPRRKYLGTPVLEGYKFIPNITTLTTEESLRVNMQLILENTLAMKVKAIELIDDYSENIPICLTPIIISVLGDQPLILPSIKILSKTPLDVNVEVEDTTLKNESDCLLVIGTHILGRPEVMKDAFNAVGEKGFILSRESLNFDISTNDLDTKITVITVHKTATEYLVLFQNHPRVHKYVTFKISSSDNFSWVPKLKEIIEKQVSHDIVIYSENEPKSGILGLINCLRREPNGQNIRCMFIMDSDKKFQQSNDQHAAQLKKNLAVNIYKNGEWGTYRHLLLDKLDSMQSEHCFANVTSRGDLSSFKWIEGPLRHGMASTADNKLVYIYYAPLNFRDVMIASGKIKAEGINRRNQDCVLGLEFSGRDEKGNRVMGMLNGGALSTLALADSYLTYKIPDSWSLAEAATVPAVYLTVFYALFIRGQMKQGESILIHSGTGGIGQAAIQTALHCGCTVFTTVGAQEKRDFLKKTFPQLKDCHIGNSRDESFEQMILNGTKGRGVDMVLNSLAEEKLLASVRCLARGGRFIEIGKFDLSNNNELNVLLLKKDASFQGVMLDMFFEESPHKKLILSKLMNEMLESGAIKPLNRTVFKFNEVEQAFRFMASGKHIGKVLVQIRNPEDKMFSIPSIQKYSCIPRYMCDPQMVYIILGGLGGFGLELADWLVLRGAEKLVLTSRSGITTGYQSSRIRIWQSYGTIVNISKADITSKSGCQELIEQSSKLGTISAIFNLAVVLSDSIFENQSPESFHTSFQPKALATQYLDEVTRELCPNLRDFVIFSSVSCGRGNAGQTNYGMANSVMERICESRRRDGYPGLAIQWGAVGDVGLVAEMQEEHIELAIGGTLQQPISSCLQVLDGLLKQKEEVIVSSIVVAEKQVGTTADNIVDAVCNVLGIADMKLISEHSTLAELGMDSMTAVEIRQILEADFNVVLSAKDLRTITLLRLKEIQTENCIEDRNELTSNEIEFGLGTILRLIGTESESHLLHMRLKSNVKETALAPRILLFPGIEGFSKVYEPLALHLNAHAICVQYSYYNTDYTVDYTVNSLLPFVEEYIPKNEPFKFIAYSYGTLIAMEVASILESKGYTGTIICLDGSELLMKEMSKILNSQTDENLQIALIVQILTIIASKQETSHYLKILNDCKSWDERLNLLVRFVKDTSTLAENYQRVLANGFYRRIKALKEYNSSYRKLKSNLQLYKAETAAIKGLPEDYGLSQIVENPVEVKTFEGNHNTMLDNELLHEALNSFINEKLPNKLNN